MRNGLAIAGMAGGVFFLGQAVASADQGAAADSGVGQDASSTGSGGDNTNVNSSEAEAKNVDVTEVSTNVAGGNGGTNIATINTGIVPGNQIVVASVEPPGGEEHPFTTITVNSGDVTLTQEANGGDVNGSGNVNVADTGGNQTAAANSDVSQSATSEGGDEHHGRNDEHNGDWNNPTSLSENTGGGDEHHGADNTNVNSSDASAINIHKVEVDTNVTGGNGGLNSADINTGIIGNTFFCPEWSTCTFNFTTGDVTLVQEANGGDVNGSGNVNVGGDGKQCECPKPEEASPAAKPAAHAAPASHQAALSSAQPSGQLAFTGSDVSLPLTVGLLALGAGAALTLAGRRQTATV